MPLFHIFLFVLLITPSFIIITLFIVPDACISTSTHTLYTYLPTRWREGSTTVPIPYYDKQIKYKIWKLINNTPDKVDALLSCILQYLHHTSSTQKYYYNVLLLMWSVCNTDENVLISTPHTTQVRSIVLIQYIHFFFYVFQFANVSPSTIWAYFSPYWASIPLEFV